MKRLMVVLLAALAAGFAGADVSVDQLTYTVSGGKATITGVASSVTPSGALNIPSTIGEADTPVTAIAAEAFKGKDRITSVTIPDSVTSAGYGAFANWLRVLLRLFDFDNNCLAGKCQDDSRICVPSLLGP